MERIRDAEVSADELTLAENGCALSLAGDFEMTANIAVTEGGLFMFGLPRDYYGGLAKQMDTIAAELMFGARPTNICNPESIVVIAVGDCARIEPELEKLQLGPVKQIP